MPPGRRRSARALSGGSPAPAAPVAAAAVAEAAAPAPVAVGTAVAAPVAPPPARVDRVEPHALGRVEERAHVGARGVEDGAELPPRAAPERVDLAAPRREHAVDG